jgi:hypothetical protein
MVTPSTETASDLTTAPASGVAVQVTAATAFGPGEMGATEIATAGAGWQLKQSIPLQLACAREGANTHTKASARTALTRVPVFMILGQVQGAVLRTGHLRPVLRWLHRWPKPPVLAVLSRRDEACPRMRAIVVGAVPKPWVT